MTALIELFPPASTEGPIEYLRRLSVRNGYVDWRSLVRATGMNPSLNALWKNKRTLIDGLGLDPAWLDGVMPPSAEGLGLHDPFFRRTTTDPVCPQCLAEADHLHHAWSHSLVSACPDHGTALVELCPSCGQALSDSRSDLASCDCGYSLREATAPSASPFERWVSARLAGDMRPFEGRAEIGAQEDYVGLGKLLFSLAIRLDPTAKVKPGKTGRPHDLAQTRALIESIRPLFEAWPQGFNTHVRDRLVAGDQSVFSPSGRLGAWYMNLHGACRKANAFAPLWTAFSDAMIDHFDGNLRGQQVLTPSPDRERRFVSVAEAARIIGVSASKLGAALKAGTVAGHVSKQGTAYTLALMDREEVERIRTERARWITANDAAIAAGVPPSVISHLVEAGLLTCDALWSRDILKSGPIEKTSIDALMVRLAALVEPRAVAETLRFGQLTGRRTTDSSGIRKLYLAIASGKVRAAGYTPGHGLDGLLFAAEDVRRYLGSVGLAEGMTLTQLETATGWKCEAISHWAQSGLLKTVDGLLHGRSARLVTHVALADFRRTWVPVSDLAQSLGTKSSALTAKIVQRGITIHGQLTLPSGAKRGGLLRLADLAVLLQ